MRQRLTTIEEFSMDKIKQESYFSSTSTEICDSTGSYSISKPAHSDPDNPYGQRRDAGQCASGAEVQVQNAGCGDIVCAGDGGTSVTDRYAITRARWDGNITLLCKTSVT